jgi:hypothetical protein
LWKPLAKIPSNVQKLVDKFAREGIITDEEEENGNDSILAEENGQQNNNSNVLILNNEPFMVVGSVF